MGTINADNARTLKIDIRSFGFDAENARKERTSDAYLSSIDIDYKYMFESSYDAILVTDRTGAILSCNDRAVEFFGYNGIRSLEGLSLHALIAGTTDALMDNICEVIREGRYMRIQAFAIMPHDNFLAVEIIARGTSKSSTEHICFLVRNVQASKEAEQTLLSAFHAMDNTDSSIGIIELDGRIAYANRKLLSMLGGGDEAKVIGQNLSIWLDDDIYVRPMIEAVSRRERWTTEMGLTDENANRFLQISAVPDIDQDDKLMGMVISINDTTDRRRAEIAENQLEKEHLMMETLSAACHAVGQPATVLLTGMELLHDNTQYDRDSRREIEDMCYKAVLELRECLKRMNAARLSARTPPAALADGMPGKPMDGASPNTTDPAAE